MTCRRRRRRRKDAFPTLEIFPRWRVVTRVDAAEEANSIIHFASLH